MQKTGPSAHGQACHPALGACNPIKTWTPGRATLLPSFWGASIGKTLCPIYSKYDMTLVTRMIDYPLARSHPAMNPWPASFVAQGLGREDTRRRPGWIQGGHERNSDGYQRDQSAIHCA